jgi:putative ABC transport system permease protein
VSGLALVLRAALLLAVTVPLFAATQFRAPLWQIFVAAVIGSGLGQLAVRVTRDRPTWIRILIASCGLLAAAIAALYFPLRGSRAAAAKRPMIAVANATPPTLTLDDATALQGIAEVAALAPVERKTEFLTTTASSWNTDVVGTTPSYLEVRGWRLAKGVPLSQEDLDRAANVVILGPTTATNLFGGSDPIGQAVRLKSAAITVVGVLAATGDPNTDDTAIVPLSTFHRKVAGGARFTGRCLILLRDGATSDPIRSLLRDRHRLAPDAPDDFVVREPN